MNERSLALLKDLLERTTNDAEQSRLEAMLEANPEPVGAPLTAEQGDE